MISLSFKPFSSSEEKMILDAVKTAEQQTSGEIRVHVEKICKRDDVLDRAVEVFYQLGMQNTRYKNGVLIYVSLIDKKMAILGDKGIHEKVPDSFWEDAKIIMAQKFKDGMIAQGIVDGIHVAGNQLAIFFPPESNDINELPDSISQG